MPALFAIPLTGPVEVQVNHADNQYLVRYYEAGTGKWRNERRANHRGTPSVGVQEAECRGGWKMERDGRASGLTSDTLLSAPLKTPRCIRFPLLDTPASSG
jgi:hypothetical protein